MVMAMKPCSQETTMRTTNDEDSVYATENTLSDKLLLSLIQWYFCRLDTMQLLSYPC